MSDGRLSMSGLWTALVTPMSGGGEGHSDVDLDALDRLVDEQIDGGVDVLVPCGTTGESPTLSHAEHDSVVARVVARAAGRVPVVAGAGSNSTREAVRLTRAAAEAGAAGVLLVCPYYNRPSQRMLFGHFAQLAEATTVPIVLYNVPSRTGIDLLPETVARLREAYPVIRAIKAASGSADRVGSIRGLCDIEVLSGDDALTLPMISVGARGVISVAANVAPDAVGGMVRAALAGDLERATAAHHRLLPLFRALFDEPNPVPVKCARRLMGRGTGLVRRPLLPALPETEARLREVLVGLDLL